MRRFHEYDGVHFIPEDVVAIQPHTNTSANMGLGCVAYFHGGTFLVFPNASADALASHIEAAIVQRQGARAVAAHNRKYDATEMPVGAGKTLWRDDAAILDDFKKMVLPARRPSIFEDETGEPVIPRDYQGTSHSDPDED